mgnify:CR=1 FL=1
MMLDDMKYDCIASYEPGRILTLRGDAKHFAFNPILDSMENHNLLPSGKTALKKMVSTTDDDVVITLGRKARVETLNHIFGSLADKGYRIKTESGSGLIGIAHPYSKQENKIREPWILHDVDKTDDIHYIQGYQESVSYKDTLLVVTRKNYSNYFSAIRFMSSKDACDFQVFLAIRRPADMMIPWDKSRVLGLVEDAQDKYGMELVLGEGIKAIPSKHSLEDIINKRDMITV